MADPGPQIVARWVTTEMGHPAFRPLRETLEVALAHRLAGRSTEQIAELAEHLMPGVHKELERLAEENIEQGIEPLFHLSGDSTSAYIQAVRTPAGELLIRLRALEPTKFEKFCASILPRLGATVYHVGGIKDGGVDFLAVDLPLGRHPGPAPRGACPIVVGQAKRYAEDNLVTEGDLRVFVGGACLRAADFKRTDPRFGIFTPVVYAFWTTSDFNATARRYARGTGLWNLSGLALAQLADRVNVSVD